MSSNRLLVTLGCPVFLMALAAIVGCGGASPALSKDGGGGTATGGAGGDQAGAGGDTSTGGGGASGAGGDVSTGTGGASAGAGGAGGGGGEAGAGGATGAAGKGGGGAAGHKDGGAGDAGPIATCKQATTCVAGDPPCLRACGTGKDVTCECGTGVLAGKLVCDNVCEKPDAGAGTDAGAIAACPATVKSGTTACTPKTESMCETACQNMMHRECVCTAVGGKAVWLCLKALACK